MIETKNIFHVNADGFIETLQEALIDGWTIDDILVGTGKKGKTYLVKLERNVPEPESYTCWLCKQKYMGKPRYISHSMAGDFTYCQCCWEKRPQ